jgi:hypothetical protein
VVAQLPQCRCGTAQPFFRVVHVVPSPPLNDAGKPGNPRLLIIVGSIGVASAAEFPVWPISPSLSCQKTEGR